MPSSNLDKKKKKHQSSYLPYHPLSELANLSFSHVFSISQLDTLCPSHLMHCGDFSITVCVTKYSSFYVFFITLVSGLLDGKVL